MSWIFSLKGRRNSIVTTVQLTASKFTQWLKSPDFGKYLRSTHFWGPVSNFGIPLAAVTDLKKDPKIISGKMTLALIIYSATFARYAWMVNPRNYLLLMCHIINETAQIVQGVRWLRYHQLISSNSSIDSKKQ